MRLYLSRQRNGDYMLTERLPVVARVAGTLIDDVYMEPGEPAGVRGLCSIGMNKFGIDLPRLASVPDDVTVTVVDDET